jgi:hypothetical protein
VATVTALAPVGPLTLRLELNQAISTQSASMGDMWLAFDAVKGRKYRLEVSANAGQPLLGGSYTLRVQFPQAGGLTLTPSSWTAPAAGGTLQVAVAGAAGATWAAGSDGRAVQVNGASGRVGQAISLTMPANTAAAERTDSVTVVLSNGQAARLPVKQAAQTAPTLLVDGTWYVRKDGRSITPPAGYPLFGTLSWKAESQAVELCGLTVKTNQTAWTASSSASWLKPSAASGRPGAAVCLAAAANGAGKDRSATVTFAAGTAKTVFSVVQTAQPTVSFSPASAAAVPARGGQVKVAVKTIGSPWQGWVDSVMWMSVDRGGGAGGETATVTVAANPSKTPRTGQVMVTSAGETHYFTIQQEGETLSLNPVLTTVAAPAAGTAVSTVVSTNAGDWRLTELPDWIKATPGQTGPAGAKLTLTFQANTSTSARYGRVAVAAGGSAVAYISVSQAGAPPPSPPSSELSATPTSQSFPQVGGRTTIVVTSEQPWVMESRPDWLMPSRPKNGPGSIEVVLLAQPNDGPERSGVVVLTAPGAKPVQIAVTQAGTTPPDNPWAALAQLLAEFVKRLLEVFAALGR